MDTNIETNAESASIVSDTNLSTAADVASILFELAIGVRRGLCALGRSTDMSSSYAGHEKCLAEPVLNFVFEA